MKKFLAALLLLSGVAVMANLAYANDEFGSGAEGLKMSSHKMQGLGSRAAKLRSSQNIGDTTYVGYTPGKFSATKNWWSIGAGFSPAASNSPAYRRNPGQGGTWDFETTSNPAQWANDSLQGWWPQRYIFTSTGGQSRADWRRPWWAIESGNNASYAMPATGGAAVKRTYGVVGVWHRDGGNTAAAPAGATTPAWAPIGGGFSAWMGLRGAADATYIDPITGNAFNETVLQHSTTGSASLFGSDNKFPGYGSQMDQMLYRDIDMTGFTGSDLTLGYSYRLKMSTGFGTATTTRTGWFDKDPLQVTDGVTSNLAAGNFISSSDAGSNAPIDSFTVYIGAPVGGTFLASDGATYPVFDPQRRWFSEVIRANEGLYKQIDRDTGTVALATKSATIPNAVLAPILAASGGKVRLVFRVHTNRGFDDQGTAYNSSNQGAAVLDDVTYSISGGGGSSPAGWGDFESSSSIDNALGVDPLNAWKSTGKPPQAYAHAHDLASLQYDDLCGQPGDPTRICDLIGNVISLGDHDNSERMQSQTDGTADREVFQGIVSPTIQLRSDGGAWPNPIGLVNPTGGDDPQDPYASEEYFLDTDIYMGVFDPFTKGVLWQFAFQSYPARDRNTPANKVWGNARTPGYIIFNPDQQCVRDFGDHNAVGNGLLAWDQAASESPDFPDSVRIMFRSFTSCFRFGVSTGCASPDGAYIDNVSFMILDGVPQPLGADIWNLFQDAFPADETTAPGYTAAYDVLTAQVKTGLNTAPAYGFSRMDVPADSAVVAASQSAGDTRVDMIFRILPGPGNYVQIGRPDLDARLRRDPSSATPITVGGSANSTNFWESYIFDPGPRSTAGLGLGAGHTGGNWNPHTWNSARCDTAEASGLFAFQGRGVLGGPASDLQYHSYLHEEEIGLPYDGNAGSGAGSRRGGLAKAIRRCFVASAGAALNDIDCVHDVGTAGTNLNGTTWDLSYISTSATVSNPATGYDGSSYNYGGIAATNVPNGSWTTEGNKIIPDGLLTPGSSVQYFFRKEDSAAPGVAAGFLPDTTTVFPQNSEGSSDAHRWQYFGVLPDRWKDPAYRHPVIGPFASGEGNPCILVVDNNDRRGNERAWVGVADTIGMTSAAKYGAHNGWHAPGTGTPAVNAPSSFVAANLGLPGTKWDMYNVKASESLTTSAGSIGGRLAFVSPDAQLGPKRNVISPRPAELDFFYKVIFFMTGDLNSGILGPFSNRTQDDCLILKNWLQNGATSLPVDRAFHAMGDGFVESNWNEGTGSDQDDFNINYLGVNLRDRSYTLASGNTEGVPDLIATATLAAPATQDIFGVQNFCLWTNDVLEDAGVFTGGQMEALTTYEAAGSGAPYYATYWKKWSATSPWTALTDGYEIEHLRSRFDTDTKGRSRYFFEVYSNIFDDICPGGVGTPVINLDVPAVSDLRQFVELAGTPMRNGGRAHIRFALTQRTPVEIDIFDVGGREVRSMVKRTFEAGQHELLWDGTDNSGRQVARGVYFTQVKLGAEKTARKVVVLN